MPKMSLAHFTVMDAHPGELVPIAAQAGFDAVGLRVEPPLPTDAVVPVQGQRQLMQTIRRQIADTGVPVLDIEAFWLMGHTDVARWRPALEVGVELGAKYVLVVGNDADQARLVNNFAWLCSLCAEHHLRPMLEFIPYAEIGTLADAAALIEQSDASNPGILVDSIHLSRSGGKPSDLETHDPGLLSYTHISDAPATPPPREQLRAESRGKRLYPGDGELWLEEHVAAFSESAPLAVEAPSEGYGNLSPNERAVLAARKTREFLQGIEKSAKMGINPPAG